METNQYTNSQPRAEYSRSRLAGRNTLVDWA